MTKPALSFNIRRRGRHYFWPPRDPSDLPTNRWGSINPGDLPEDAYPLPSVTNVLSASGKGDGLLYWAAECAIRAIYDSGSLPLDADQAVNDFKGAFNDVRRQRAEAGDRAHTLAHRLTEDMPLPSRLSEEDEAYADAYMAWWSDVDPNPLHVETTVFAPEVGYAGTPDLLCEVDGTATVVDYKTRGERPDAKKVDRYGLLYDENRMQLAALASAPWVSDGGFGYELAPEVTSAVGVVLLPDGGYLTETLDKDDLVRWFAGFRGLLGAWRALKGVDA